MAAITTVPLFKTEGKQDDKIRPIGVKHEIPRFPLGNSSERPGILIFFGPGEKQERMVHNPRPVHEIFF